MPIKKKKKVEEVPEVTENTVAEEPVIEESKPVKKADVKKMFVNTELLNIREKPDMNSKVLTLLVRDTEVDVESIEKGWAKVLEPKAGYAMAEFLK